MKKTFIVIVLLFLLLPKASGIAAGGGGILCGSCNGDDIDTATQAKHVSRHQLKNKFLNRLYEKVKDFSRVDTSYIEPQKYNFTVMMQNTNTIERYQLTSKKGHTIEFSPEPSWKLGPYFGWRWIFLGYTIDLAHLRGSDNRQDLDISLYSNQIGIDLFFRKTGDNYKIKRMTLDPDVDTRAMKNVDFNGFKASIKGFNLYYIFNHKKFSYPAAYSQSTIQRRSAGSPLIGIGYTKHGIDIDWNKLDGVISKQLGQQVTIEEVDSGMRFDKVEFYDYSISCGYAYNWVFARNWLFDASLSLGVSYKRSTGDVHKGGITLRDFDFKNFNIDGVSRVGIVWNNMKWYIGSSAIFHTYNYEKSQFRTNTTFGSFNIYVGFNFGKR